MEMGNRFNKYIALGVILAVIFWGAFIFLDLIYFIFGNKNISKNKLRAYECFQVIRDAENSEWNNFGVREEYFDDSIFAVYRTITNTEADDEDGLKFYKMRIMKQHGMRLIRETDGKVSVDGHVEPISALVVQYKDRTGYIKFFEESDKYVISSTV